MPGGQNAKLSQENTGWDIRQRGRIRCEKGKPRIKKGSAQLPVLGKKKKGWRLSSFCKCTGGGGERRLESRGGGVPRLLN